jgi:alkaline phosphatase D
MLELDPHFFVHTGDILYYDSLAKTVELARYHWQRTFSWPTNVEFHRHVASYFMKDDHDTWKNDCWPTMKSPYMHEFTFRQGQAIFREQVPMGRRTYRTVRWGKDLQIWMVEGRDFRSPNNAPDGPDRPSKRDNHSNKVFAHEGNDLRKFIATQKNLVVVCGDRHWQYMSVDPETGVREYSCGPASDQHAGGWKQDDFIKEYHRYLNVIGGFLSATVERTNGVPNLTFRYHDANGNIQFEDRLVAD